MTARAQAVVFAIAAVVFVGIVALVRRRALKERYALLWLGIGSGVVVLAAVRPWLDALSEALGIRSGTTTLFLAATLFLLGLILHLSVTVSRLQEQVRDLAEAVAITQSEVEESRPQTQPPVATSDQGQNQANPDS